MGFRIKNVYSNNIVSGVGLLKYGGASNLIIIVTIVVASIVLLIIAIIIAVLLCKRRKPGEKCKFALSCLTLFSITRLRLFDEVYALSMTSIA